MSLENTTVQDEDIVCSTTSKMANNAYENLLKCFGQGHEAATLLFSTDETSSNVRGFLLGRPWGEGATVHDLITCRLQHDVGYSEMMVRINNQTLVEIPPMQTMSNKEMINQLCVIFASFLRGYSNSDRIKFSWGKNKVNKRVINAFYNIGKRKRLTMQEVGI